MAFFTVYGDESYTHAKGRYADTPFIIAGYIGPTKSWKKFAREWKRLLKAEGLEYFHMADCDGGYTDQFSHLKISTSEGRAERDRLQRVFIGAINRSEIYGVAAGIPQSHFQSVFDALSKYLDPTPDNEGPVLTPYLFAFTSCINAVCRRLRGHEDKQFAMIFDQQGDIEAAAQRTRARLVNNPLYADRLRIGPLTYCSKKIAIPLQAADILAYEVMREMRDPDLRRWQRALLDKKRPVTVEYFTADKVAWLVSELHAEAVSQNIGMRERE